MLFMNKKNSNFMNKREADLLLALYRGGAGDQRAVAARAGCSLGTVNAMVTSLQEAGLLNAGGELTDSARALLAAGKPRRAVILAAGTGLRMVPYNTELPKALLTVRGEKLIERLIRQLHEAGVFDVTVVVGFMKEAIEYLIDRYQVRLCVNGDYLRKNNLHSLIKAEDQIADSYILPSDIWFAENPFSDAELYSWYAVGDAPDPEGYVIPRRDLSLRFTGEGETGPAMIGASYIAAAAAPTVRERLRKYCASNEYNTMPWENLLFDEPSIPVYCKVLPGGSYFEINTYEELKDFDGEASHLSSSVIDLLCGVLSASKEEITGITLLKKGMTNRSFLFDCKGVTYIMRIPGEGSGELINRRQEYEVYRIMKDSGLTDRVLYISPDTGYKLTEFWPGARVCDPENPRDVARCMGVLRAFHEKDYSVPHSFDLFERMEYYESLLRGAPSIFPDYGQTKAAVLGLRDYIDAQPKRRTLCHIDSVPDNFLFVDGEVKLIDWEYAAMQDPHVDITMFAVYAMYDRAHVEALIDSYFPEGCPAPARKKIYCYIAACGLLWSNWCEYKRTFGVEFGEYALAQYRFAKEYSRIAMEAEV